MRVTRRDSRVRLQTIALPVALVALLAACTKTMPPVADDAPASVQESIGFRNPVPNDEHAPTEFAFTVLGSAITIGVDGQVRWVRPHHPPVGFRLPLNHGDSIEGFYYGALEHDLVLYLQISDGHYVGSSVMRLDPGTGEVRWNTPGYAFNIGKPLAVGPWLYITSFGFVGKLDLETGRFAWKHDNLYTDGVYNAFQKPLLTRSGTVIFRESSWDREGDKALYLIVRDADGAILRRWQP